MIIRRQTYVINFIHKALLCKSAVVLLVNNKCNLYYSNYKKLTSSNRSIDHSEKESSLLQIFSCLLNSSCNIFYHNIVSILVNPNHRKKENSYFHVESSLHMEVIGFLPVKLNLIKLIN